jgi:hypothetical protein
MIVVRPRLGLASAGLLALATTLSACQATVSCDAALRANAVAVTIDGDDSQVDRVFVCATSVKDCVVPRQPGDPVVSRGPGPWTVNVMPVREKPTEADVYVVDLSEKVLTKERVTLTWATDTADEQCGSTYKAAVTVKL